MNLREAIDWGKLSPLRLTARAVADGLYSGAHRSVRRGAGIEFGGHRRYVPGDDLRFLDRHARMRHGTLLVREFETETDRALRVIVDASASMAFKSPRGSGAKYAYAALIAAALTRIAVLRGDRVALDFVAGERTLPLPSTGGREAFERVIGHLESGVPDGATDTASLDRALAPTARYARRGSLLVFLSDLIDLPAGAPEQVSGLSGEGRSLVVVRVLDPLEADFGFEGPIALRSMEGDVYVETEAAVARERYLAALSELSSEWEARLLARGSRLVLARTDEEPVEVVRRVLMSLQFAGDPTRGWV